jgi:hypothetical protein
MISMTLDEFKDYIKEKNILIIGNALGALDQDVGEKIDSYDIVLRFGKGIPSKAIYKNVGTRTDVWVTGELRMHEHRRLPEDCKILFNNSRYRSESKKPFDTHLDMYTYAEIHGIERKYNVSKNHSFSAGAITSHWLANVATGWKSLTWINFNIFTAATKIYNPIAKKDSYSTSWHLPLLKKEVVDKNYDFMKQGDISHDCKAEINMYKDLLKMPNTHWIGEMPTGTRLTLLSKPRAAWRGREPRLK